VSRLRSLPRPANFAAFASTTAVAAALAFTLSGCGTMTTAPLSSMVGSTDAAPSSARLSAGNTTAASAPAKMPDDPGDNRGAVDTTIAPGAPAADGVATSVLTGFTAGRGSSNHVTSTGADVTSAGGTLSLGRWTLTVPANAVPAGAHFTLSVAGLRGAACQVQLTPANTVITAPLTLSVDLHGVPANRTSSFVILAYDPASGQWTPVPGSQTDSRKHSGVASIPGAGIYGAGYPDGRAGW